MKKRRDFEPNPITPLDNWSINVDPAIMSGDHWVQEENAPLEEIGYADSKDCHVVQTNMTPPKSMFMHPTINVSYKNINRETNKEQ